MRTATDLAEQLAFDLPHRPAMGRADFLVSAGNAAALAALDAWRGWPNGRMILVGPAGAGKTHLAQVWTAATGARLVATLAKLLAEKGSGRGLISICTAGGMGVAAILERA